MKFIASLLILIGSFVLIWSALEIFLSLGSDHTSQGTDNAFGTPVSGIVLIAIGGSLLIYLRRKIR